MIDDGNYWYWAYIILFPILILIAWSRPKRSEKAIFFVIALCINNFLYYLSQVLHWQNVYDSTDESISKPWMRPEYFDLTPGVIPNLPMTLLGGFLPSILFGIAILCVIEFLALVVKAGKYMSPLSDEERKKMERS